ncbi:MAG TPA: type II toxin-antitoxin system RelE/ParE family toxin [Terracidiphilus sp.]|nr:type II toxin-antitoxin system RelE/ParE family toxin [Terracidiphilus sp.]
MPAYRLSRLARLDLIEIADYTVDTWGPQQAYRYLDSLEAFLHQLAQTPEMGRPCNAVRSGYRRMEHEKHVLFYRVEQDAIFISRILHQRMLPSRHLLEDS